MKILAFACLLFSISASHAAAPLEGIYKLTGRNSPKADKTYGGKVVVEKTADTYKLTWLIGAAQSQKGVAILDGNILSVGYMDLSGRDFGVVSYKVLSEKKLEGKWSPIAGSGGYGTELLEYEKPLDPTDKPTESKGF